MTRDRPDLGGRDYESTRHLLHRLESRIRQLPLSEAVRLQIGDALNLMLHAHYRQAGRLDGEHYVNHPLAVALTVIETFGVTDPAMIMAALLHDTVEDQAPHLLTLLEPPAASAPAVHAQALQAIAATFGHRVAELVGLLTNPDFDALLAENQATGQLVDKYTLYRNHFAAIHDQDPDAFLIKLADFSQNALNLHRLAEGAAKQHFRRKYGPVILMVIQLLAAWGDPTHPLFARRDALIARLEAVYDRDYAGAPGPAPS